MAKSKIISSWKELIPPIGIFGGTFDPIQKAHTEIARIALEQKKLGSVVFVPAKQNPLKTTSPTATDSQRTEMLAIAIAQDERFFISVQELKRAPTAPSYTVLTLREARVACGSDTPIYFIGGGDVVAGLPKWHAIEEIFSHLNGFIVIQREKPIQEEIKQLRGVIKDKYIDILTRDAVSKAPIYISSTDIRHDIEQGVDVSTRLDPRVYEYILTHKLYQSR